MILSAAAALFRRSKIGERLDLVTDFLCRKNFILEKSISRQLSAENQCVRL